LAVLLLVPLFVLLTVLSPALGHAAETTRGPGILVLPLFSLVDSDPSAAVGFGLAATLESLDNKIPALPETYLAHHLASLATDPEDLMAAYADGERHQIPDRVLASWAEASGRRLLVSGVCRLAGDQLRAELSVYDAATGRRRQHQLSGTFANGLIDLKGEWLALLDHYGVHLPEARDRLLNPETRSMAAFRANGLSLRHWLVYLLDRELGGESRAALDAARQAVAADGQYALALDTLAYILWWEGEQGEAARLFSRALAQDPVLMDALDGTIGLALAGGRAEEARDLARRKGALRQDEGAGAKERIDAQLADVAFKEGRLAERGGGWQEALAWYEQGLALLGPARAAGADPEALAFRRAAAVAKEAMGREQEALAEFRDLLALSRQTDGPCATPIQATLLQDQGDLLLNQGRVEEALAEYRASLACREVHAGTGKRLVAESYGRIASALMQRADYQGAEEVLHRAREILVRELGPDHPESGRISNTLGVVSMKQGLPAEALTWYEQALTTIRRHQGANHGDSAALRNNLGLALSSLAEYGRARAAFHEALAVYRAQGQVGEQEVAAVCTNLGLLSYALADFGPARTYFEEALAIRLRLLGPGRLETADAYHNLAAVFQAQGAAGQALANEELALAIRQKALDPEHPDLAESYHSLGSMRFGLGEYEAAGVLHEKALAITLKSLGPWHPETGLGYYNLGTVAVAGHDFDLALAKFDQALAIAERAGDRELLWRLYRELSRVHKGLGQTGTAIFWGKQAVNTIQAMRRQSADLGRTLRQTFVADKESAFRELALLLADEGRFAEAIRVIDLLKGEEYFDFIRREQEEATGLGGQLPFSRVEQGWQAGYETLRGQGAAMTRADDLAAASAELAALRAAMEREGAAARPAGTEATPDPTDPARLDALRQGLAKSGAGTVALYYLLAEHGLSILLVTPDTHLVRQVAIEADRLADLSHRFRLRLTSPGSDPLPEAGRLYRTLVAPIAEELTTAGARRILLVVDGSLRYLPFAALHDGHGYLAERYAFSLLTPAQPPAAPDQGGRPLRVAALGVAEGREGFTPLPAVQEELDRIVKEGADDPVGVLPGVVRLNRAFSRAALAEALGQGFPVVHLASHFVSRPGTAADSYLLLGDGGHLDLDQLRRQRVDLRPVELLTLSACDTALGQSDGNGRELESLAVLVQRQGAKAVLASLWPVADRSTALFMQSLYASLRQPGSDPGAALRQAQHTLLTGDPAFSHPYFWAPFVLMGAGQR
jgi:CHAT domain-containing protein/tetratricopeptide (TPR) repeat protein